MGFFEENLLRMDNRKKRVSCQESRKSYGAEILKKYNEQGEAGVRNQKFKKNVKRSPYLKSP
jgi:hypothetical protein